MSDWGSMNASSQPRSLAPAESTERTLYQTFLETAQTRSLDVAWIERPSDRSTPWTWKAVADRVHAVAAHLESHGIRPGDRIANLCRNSLGWAILDLACSALGAVHAPLDRRLPNNQRAAILDRLKPALLVDDSNPLEPAITTEPTVGPGAASNPTHRAGPPPLQTAPLETACSLHDMLATSAHPSATQLQHWQQAVDPNDLACILHTSGTSGLPKGVMLSHRNLSTNARAKLDAMPQSHTDLRLNLLPFAHAYAKTCELGTWIVAGGTMLCVRSISECLDMATAIQPHLLNGVPAFFESLWERWQAAGGHPDALHTLLGGRIRRLASGGAPLRESMRSAFATAGLPIFQGYGLTETSPVVCSNRAGRGGAPHQLDGVGPAVQDVALRVDNEQRLWVRGPGVMLGYWRDPIATHNKIVDGWLDTGDRVAISSPPLHFVDYPDATPLTIEGRCDDVQVLTTGYKFSPLPIERCINLIPSIEACIVIGNGRRSPLLVARLRSDQDAEDPETLLALVRQQLVDFPEYAHPTRVIFESEPWSIDSGALHWKGTLQRLILEDRYANRID
jgi:long-chain acyl-CoA synthetase